LFRFEKKQGLINSSDIRKSSRPAKIQTGAYKSIRQPSMLDNLGVMSPNIASKAQTSKVRVSNRMKSNDSKRSQTHCKNDNVTINTQELTNFFEHRISKNDQYRRIYSNNMLKRKNKNATTLLDYGKKDYDSNQRLNNTVIVDNYRLGGQKRESRKTRISMGAGSIFMAPITLLKEEGNKLESAYCPIKLKKKLMYDSKMAGNMQKFPSMLNSKGMFLFA
jgi:hypothetical protein